MVKFFVFRVVLPALITAFVLTLVIVQLGFPGGVSNFMYVMGNTESYTEYCRDVGFTSLAWYGDGIPYCRLTEEGPVGSTMAKYSTTIDVPLEEAAEWWEKER